MQQAKLSIELSEEARKAIYDDIFQIAQRAVKEATDGTANKRHLTQQELMKLYRVGTDTISGWVDDGLKYVMVGRKKLFDLEDVYKYLDEQKI